MCLNCCWHGSCQVVKLSSFFYILMADIFIYKTCNRFNALAFGPVFFFLSHTYHISVCRVCSLVPLRPYAVYNRVRCQCCACLLPILAMSLCIRRDALFFQVTFDFVLFLLLVVCRWMYRETHVNQIIFVDLDWRADSDAYTVLLIDPLCAH